MVSGISTTCLSGQPLLDEPHYYTEANYNAASLKQPKREWDRSCGELKTNKAEEDFKEESSVLISELFHGFLAIGTLGSESLITEPETPTFSMSFQNATAGEKQVTETELKLISDELEKFLEAEAKEVSNESSERSSHASIITLSGKPIEGADAEEDENLGVCPLQGYLFGSSIELPERSVEAKKKKTSLGELFKQNTIAYEHSTEKCGKEEKQSKGKYASCFMKNILKKLQSSRSCKASASCDANESISKRKLPKVLRMFHKKIHPEKSAADKQLTKAQRCQIKDTSGDGGYHNGDPTVNEDNRKFPDISVLKKEFTTLNPSHKRLNSGGSAGNTEYWIKTDADYRSNRNQHSSSSRGVNGQFD
ncbi:unnamed protein product [Ilex paraguariensis]|uniref:Protein LAZY 1 n=1 Tax=Ilex paraguariensis TaxID=185542 RepID=A0ABC8URP3_9AQUA